MRNSWENLFVNPPNGEFSKHVWMIIDCSNFSSAPFSQSQDMLHYSLLVY
jgi:hypothetical protein